MDFPPEVNRVKLDKRFTLYVKEKKPVHKESDKWESDKSDGGLRIAVAGVHLDSERFA